MSVPAPTTEVALVPLSQVSDGARDAFYARMYARRVTFLSENWRWLYRVGWVSGVEPIAACVGGEMIGQAGVIPVGVNLGGLTETAGWFVDFSVVPEKQGTGLGRRLAEAWMLLCKHDITHCNDLSIKIFLRLAWQQRFRDIRCAVPIGLSALVRRRGALIRTGCAILSPIWRLLLTGRYWSAPRLTPEQVPDAVDLEPIFRPVERGTASVARDSEWIHWRVHEAPWAASHRLFRVDGAAALVRALECEGQRRLHILWLDPKADLPAARRLVGGITRWALEHDFDLVWAMANGGTPLRAFRTQLRWHVPTRFAAFSRDAAAFESLLSPSFSLQAIDGDVDLVHTPDEDSDLSW